MSLLEIRNEILNEFFEVDGNVATITFNFESVEEIIEENYGKGKKIKSDFFTKIDETLDLLPRKMKLRILIHFNNFDFDVNYFMDLVKKNLNFNNLERIIFEQRKIKRTFLMLGFGVSFFILYFLSLNYNFPQILTEIFNIAAWVFIWEAVTIFFIEFKDERRHHRNLKKRLLEFKII